MSKLSRDSLQWQSATNIFTSIMIAGLIAIFVTASFYYYQVDSLLIFSETFIVFYAGAVLVLILFALLFASRTYIVLSRPMDNLEQITHALPLLSAKKYDEAKGIFKVVESLSKHHEINQLQYASMQLSSVLQKLDGNVLQRSKMIHAKNSELQHERDFIKNLVNTAQLIIITVDKELNVTLFNHYAEKITGVRESDMLYSGVANMFPAGNWTEAQTLFHELLDNHINIAQQEAELIDVEGSIKEISWLHTRIEGNSNESVILSVGLDMTEKKAAEKRIVWLAEHDPLTNLCNRRKFMAEFDKSLQTAIRYQHNNTLLFLDLDEFKDINDTSGHRAGDELLKSVADTLNKATRYTDLVARLGGDEFAILMPESDPQGAAILAKKIITELSLIELKYGKVSHKVSTSIGIVHFPLSDANIHELLGFSDLAMYKAKSDGKGTFHTFSADDKTKDELETRVFWKHQIETALADNNFVLNYQPILDIQTNIITHYEVLIRMRDTQTGKIRMPGKFIEIAEQVGLIHSIDHYVLQHSMKRLAQLNKQGVAVKFAINLSGSVIDDPLLLPMLKRLIKEYEINPENLIFEVTETAAVSNLQQAKVLMTSIRKLGCRFALDDFGVGFSTFNYMRELPTDIIKIDGIFIKDLDKNADDQLFVKALVDVAKGLGHKTIAEFVENREILDILKKYGVDYAQGYYIGRPDENLQDSPNWQPPEAE